MAPDDMDDTDPLDSILAEEINPVPPGGPPGAPWIPGMNILPEAMPEATPATMVCLRGPCVHYVEMTSRFKHGNTPGTLDHVPKQCNRFCTAIPGESIELTDELVMDCNKWDPVERNTEYQEREDRRLAYKLQTQLDTAKEDKS